jgi:hypothetical protein
MLTDIMQYFHNDTTRFFPLLVSCRRHSRLRVATADVLLGMHFVATWRELWNFAHFPSKSLLD